MTGAVHRYSGPLDEQKRQKIIDLHVKHGVQVTALAQRYRLANDTIRGILNSAGVQAMRRVSPHQASSADAS